MIEEEPILFYRKAPDEIDPVLKEVADDLPKETYAKSAESSEIQQARLVIENYRALDFDDITTALTVEYNAAIALLTQHNINPFPDHSPISKGVSAPFTHHEY